MTTRKGSNAPQAISADEKRWRAQSDADTLARAQEILGDKQRHSAARSYASKEAERYSKVAKTSNGGRRAPAKR
jgi:hypothetical protein